MEELRRFLVKAKINAYASGREAAVLEDGCKELIFNEGKFLYRDRYFGFNPFIGEEVVFCEEECIWSGHTIPSEGISPKEVYAFLQEVLKRVNEEKPFRGWRNMKRISLGMLIMWKAICACLMEAKKSFIRGKRFTGYCITVDLPLEKPKL